VGFAKLSEDLAVRMIDGFSNGWIRMVKSF
jgi:hypothetical protein